MTLEAILALGTAVVALGHSLWTARRLPPKPQKPLTKLELYGTPPPKPRGKP